MGLGPYDIPRDYIPTCCGGYSFTQWGLINLNWIEQNLSHFFFLSSSTLCSDWSGHPTKTKLLTSLDPTCGTFVSHMEPHVPLRHPISSTSLRNRKSLSTCINHFKRTENYLFILYVRTLCQNSPNPELSLLPDTP